jgi:hypothetical protein
MAELLPDKQDAARNGRWNLERGPYRPECRAASDAPRLELRKGGESSERVGKLSSPATWYLITTPPPSGFLGGHTPAPLPVCTCMEQRSVDHRHQDKEALSRKL